MKRKVCSTSLFEEGNDFSIWDTCSLQKAFDSNIFDTKTNSSTLSDTGLKAQVGVTPYTEKELLQVYRTRLDGEVSCVNVHIPDFNSQGITTYRDSSLDWVWLTDGNNYFNQDGTRVRDQQNDSNSYGFDQMTEIIEAVQANTKITFPVGGAVKTYNSTIYMCSPHTANVKKHKADFSILGAWCIYQKRVVTDDVDHFGRDLAANGAEVYSTKCEHNFGHNTK
ncbi:hypothetical protein C5S53_15905 [Methanophagales archaeon]|nr:hypothetical protein C5S53_15905 [Methanophagales archaeon]